MLHLEKNWTVAALALFLLVAGTASALPTVPTPQQASQTVKDTASSLNDQVHQLVPLPPAPPQQGPSQGKGSSGSGSSTSPSQSPAPQPSAVSKAQTAATQAQAAIQKVRDQVPDPLGVVGGISHDARTKAEELQHTLTSPVADTQVPQETQSSGAKQVQPSGLTYPILTGSVIVAGATGAAFIGFWLAGSSGTVSAGGAAAKAAGSRDLRRLLPYASPLFTRFERDTVLGHPRREGLYALILQQPGISLQALGEASGLSRTAALHHLRLMEQSHVVVSKRVGRSRHYYENGGRYGRDQKDAYAVLQNDRSREVADFIRHHPGTMQKAVCDALGIQPSIAHWHVRRLQSAELVESVRQGRTVNYFPARGLLEVAPIPEAAVALLPMGPSTSIVA